MRVAIATFSALPAEFTDDERLSEALAGLGIEVDRIPWDDRATDWDSFDSVIIRSTWDYSKRQAQYLRWVDSVGQRLHNSPEIVRWNSDKHYLGDLAAAGIAVVATAYVEPGDPPPDFTGDVVVKPAVSAGARDTGRFSARTYEQARRLIERIHATGRTVMVQPYQQAVDVSGETAIVCLDGDPSHALRKGAVLRPDEVAPVRDDGVGAAEVMYDPGLVVRGVATDAQLALARTTLAYVSERFGEVPLYARVDLVPGVDGQPIVMELELIEPNLYLNQAPGAAERVAAAIVHRTQPPDRPDR